MHTCDNPRCVNPEHLVLGTQADNVRDMHAKGRNAKVPSNKHSAKVGPDDVRAIRRMLQSGERRGDIAKAFGVSRTCIGYIATGHTWSDVQ